MLNFNAQLLFSLFFLDKRLLLFVVTVEFGLAESLIIQRQFSPLVFEFIKCPNPGN